MKIILISYKAGFRVKYKIISDKERYYITVKWLIFQEYINILKVYTPNNSVEI